MSRRRLLLVVPVLALLAAGIALAAPGLIPGRIGPTNGIQPSGRHLVPAGKMTRVGNHPGGGALTEDGRFFWTLSAGRGANDIRIVRVASSLRCKKPRRPRRLRAHKRYTRRAKARYRMRVRRYRARVRRYRRCRKRRAAQIGQVVQTIPMPGLSGGIAMTANGLTAYVSGLKESEHDDQKVGAAVPGRQGDVIHEFHLNRRTGRATRGRVLPVPPPSDSPALQEFPPSVRKGAWPRDVAVSPDGSTLIAALNLADRAAIVDTKSGSVRYAKVGRYPYGAAITRDGRLGLVSNEVPGTVSVIDLRSGDVIKTIQVGPRLSHPEGIAIDPRRPRAYVAVANQDLVAVIDLNKLAVERTLSVARPQGTGTTPVALNVSRDGCFLMSADAGEDAVAVFALPGANGRTCRNDGRRKAKPRHKARAHRSQAASRKKRRRKRAPALSRPFQLVGRVPVGSYPVAVDATPARRTLVWLSAKGLGVGPNRNGPNPNSPADDDDHINSFGYLPSLVRGSAGVLAFPTDKGLRKLTPKAAQQIRPTNAAAPPPGTPLRGGGPIKHVFYVVKENRTYDQLLGDDSRGDGDPGLTLFGEKVTPNLHALARRFPLLDHVYANSEASIDGHYWTAAGAVSDYVIKSWHQNYAGRGRPYDFGAYVVSAPPKNYIFQRAENEGVSYFNYGEALAGVSPLPDNDRTDAETQQGAKVLLNSDIGLPAPGCYDSDISNSTVLSQGQVDVYDSSAPLLAKAGSRSRFDCFRARFTSQVATNSVPSFNYMVLPNDHTEGTTPGRRTPTAQMASNDLGLGQIVDTISHSEIWKSSLILVLEDDSQDGADHVDAHRIPALAISPYTRRGAVVHNRYDQLSFLRTAEILVGLKPLHLAEAMALPLYDAFSSGPDNAEAYSAITPEVDLTARNSAASPAAKLSAALPLNSPDRVPQRVLDRILWKSVHGRHAAPPPPGPNAVGEEQEEHSSREVPLPRVR